jgi:hypothetical protein
MFGGRFDGFIEGREAGLQNLANLSSFCSLLWFELAWVALVSAPEAKLEEHQMRQKM